MDIGRSAHYNVVVKCMLHYNLYLSNELKLEFALLRARCSLLVFDIDIFLVHYFRSIMHPVILLLLDGFQLQWL